MHVKYIGWKTIPVAFQDPSESWHLYHSTRSSSSENLWVFSCQPSLFNHFENDPQKKGYFLHCINLNIWMFKLLYSLTNRFLSWWPTVLDFWIVRSGQLVTSTCFILSVRRHLFYVRLRYYLKFFRDISCHFVSEPI